MDIVFVVLNYNVYQETIDCVESIRTNIDTSKYHIIIVDNASLNKVGERLKEHYQMISNVTVIDSKVNLGFARGNNLGINYAKENFSPRFVCCLNNDTLLEKKDFYINLECGFERTKAAIIGPKVILNNGEVQKFYCEILSIYEYKKQLLYLWFNGTYVRKIRKIILNIIGERKFRHIFDIFRNNIKDIKNDKYFNKERSDVVLHGCCLVFTPEFLSNANGFDERTFMFKEEELLYIMIKKLGLHTLYLPEIEIKHLEDISTNTVYKDEEKKYAFMRKNQILSLKVLIKELSR